MQARRSAATGYFFFMAGYFYDENNDQFWCVVSHEYEYNADVNQWRDAKSFSNLPSGHNQQPVMADFDANCNVVTNGASVGSGAMVPGEIVEAYPVRFVFRNPKEVDFTIAGHTYRYKRFAWTDSLTNPSLDWVMDYQWNIATSVSGYINDSNSDPESAKLLFNYNANMGFEKMDLADAHQSYFLNYIGHKSSYKYYISDAKVSYKSVVFFNYGATPYEPYLDNQTNSNKYWIVLVHDTATQTVMAFTAVGEKQPGGLEVYAGVPIKFRAVVNPDADVLNFYPYLCEGTHLACRREASIDITSDMATWSPQNVHASTMKMTKLGPGGKRYRYMPNVGESNSAAQDRIKQMMVDDGLIDP